MFSFKLRIVLVLLGAFVPYIFAQYTGCDYAQTVIAGQSYDVFSPGYSSFYKANTNCRWQATAPKGYNINLSCSDVYMPSSTGCSNDQLEVSTQGLASLSDAHRYCGVGTFTTSSKLGKMTIALRTPTSTTGGRFLCKISSQQCQCGRRKTTKIVGGLETNVNEFPQMAGIVNLASSSIFCGATIISSQYGLTAAHCLNTRQPADIGLLVGDHDYTTGADTTYAALYGISKIVVHPNYKPSPVANDIALVKTSTVMTFNAGVGPICLPWQFATTTFAGSKVDAAGWGTLEFGGPQSKKLMKVTLDVLTNTDCQNRLGSATVINSAQMCTFSTGKDTCQYDSGGPIFYTNPTNGLLYQVGVVSFGVACASNKPGVSTRVTDYLQWIIDNTPEETYCDV